MEEETREGETNAGGDETHAREVENVWGRRRRKKRTRVWKRYTREQASCTRETEKKTGTQSKIARNKPSVEDELNCKKEEKEKEMRKKGKYGREIDRQRENAGDGEKRIQSQI